jgi:hypothetical protein
MFSAMSDFLAAPALDARPAAAPAPWAVPVPECAGVVVKIASEPAEWEQAFRLVAANYQAQGYDPPGAGALRFTPHHALPDTVTFVAREQGRVVATLSLVPDNTVLGLPLERIYGPEVAALRSAGRRLAEVVSLAGEGTSFPVTFALMRLMTHYFLRQQADAMLISVHPRHRPFYQRMFGFVVCGPRRDYPAVQNHPAEALLLDGRLLRGEVAPRYREMLGTPPPAQALVAPRLPEQLARSFARCAGSADAVAEVLRRARQVPAVRRIVAADFQSADPAS